MFTRSLFKPFLMFTLLALLLLPQIGETEIAFAANPASSDAVPGPKVCLSISNTTISNGHIVPLDSPPGEGVGFTINYDVENNCESTVGNIIISGPVEGACPEGSVNLLRVAYPVRGNLASGQHVGEPDKGNTAYCAVEAKGSTSSEVPTGISMSLSAAGIDTNRASVVSPVIPLVVIKSKK
jgi:hypothetical protein